MATAEVIRLANWNVEMDRAGPGLLARDIAKGGDPQIEAALRVLAVLDADVILLTGFDHDHDRVAARLFADRLGEVIAPYPHVFALRPNTGMQTGLDLDLDGRLGGPGDAQGWGRFSGQGAMAILSRLAVDEAAVRDFSGFLWADLPGALLHDGMTDEVRRIQRLATTGHWEVPLILPDGGRLRLLAWHATPPVFGGAEGRNARRNHDEAAFWLALFDGLLPMPPPEPPFVMLADSNMDPEDGDGLPDAIRALLAHPALNDVRPRGSQGRTEPGHRGDPALDTAVFVATGGLRVDLVVPGAGLEVVGAGVLWPAESPVQSPAETSAGADPLWRDLQAASRHFPVWVDLVAP
ncbi:endonuclease/exonuclease/phosphatase family protein [Pseudogemmobacter sonorensis]|uniref:endonuclease/exonuclease/phosphatase family protein n=1 Tax=Pseudogemmobacter sonorensis TaxID=2989681 RepID=UPI003693607F